MNPLDTINQIHAQNAATEHNLYKAQIAKLEERIQELEAVLTLERANTRCAEHVRNNHSFYCTVCRKPFAHTTLHGVIDEPQPET